MAMALRAQQRPASDATHAWLIDHNPRRSNTNLIPQQFFGFVD
jgi:hypothetical protein